ncbi:venom allergen 3 homolog [Amblyomma americanum]
MPRQIFETVFHGTEPLNDCRGKTFAERPVAGGGPRFPRVGQNVGWRGENRNRSSVSWSQRIKNWFDEHKYYPTEGIGSFRVIRGHAKTGHFTQLMWGDTRCVGCGYTFYTLKNDNSTQRYQTTQVCNYGPRLSATPVTSEPRKPAEATLAKWLSKFGHIM